MDKCLNQDTIKFIYERVITDGNIYNNITFPMLQEIALEINIGLLQDNGEEKMYKFFIPSIEQAFKDLRKEALIDVNKFKDYSLLNKVCISKLSKEYYIEIGNLLYEYYLEHIKYMLD